MTTEQILYGLAIAFITALLAPLAIMFWQRVFGKKDGVTQAAENLTDLVGSLSAQLATKEAVIGQKDAVIAHLNAQLVEALQANTREYKLIATIRANPASVEFRDIETQPVHNK